MGFMLNCISTKYPCQHCLTEPDIIIIVSVELSRIERPPPKRKVVGSNPARNANLEGGDRKNRFPLLLSQKTISV